MTMQKVILSGLFLFLIVFPSYAFADGPYLNIPPTNAFDKIHSDNGTVSAVNFSMPLNIKGGSGITVQSSNGSHTVIISETGGTNTSKGTYNQTLANNSVVNSGGYKLNFINGTGNPISLKNSANGINITISSTGSSGVTSLNALSGALTISCVAGNTTCTTSGGNTITINTAYNIATLNLNEIFSGITTMNSLKLGGQMNINGNTMQSFGHVYTWQNKTGTVCLTNQTSACGPAGSATYDTLVNIGTGEASVYAGNTTKTNFQFKTLKQGSHISLANNTNDVTISTTGLLSSALLSLNGDSSSAQVVDSGNTNHITVTNAGASHHIDIAFKLNNATCSNGYFVSSFSNVTGIYSCSLGNSGTITTASNIGHGGKGFFSSVSGSTIQLRNLTSLRTDLFTVSQNTTDVKLSSSFKSNNITCSAGNAVTSFNNSTGTYTCSPFGSLSAAITSINGDTTAAQKIVRQFGNTTITNSTGTVTIGFGVNPVIINGAAQTVTKGLTLNALTLGGNALGNSKNFTGLSDTNGTRFFQGSNRVVDTISGTAPVTATKSGASYTVACSTCLTGTKVDSITGTAHNVTASSSTGAVTLNTGDNVVVTGGATQNFTKLIINNAGLTMSHSDISLGSNKLKTSTYQLIENTGLAGWVLSPSSGNNAFLLHVAPSGTSNTAGIRVYRTSDTTTNYQYFNLRSDDLATGEFSLRVQNGGTQNLVPLNFYMGAGKLESYDVTNTMTSYVQNIWTPISDPVKSFTNAIWKSSTNTDVLKYRNNANTTTYNILSTLGTVLTATPADPTGTTQGDPRMMGLASSFTPAVTTRADITICGQMSNSAINDGATIQLRYGTGTAPSNSVAVTGTQLGASQTFTALVAGQRDGYCVTGIATGLTIGTTYWIDLALNAITAGTATTTGITIKAHET